jgi:hypothetical protein
MEHTNQMRVSARIPADLFFKLENERHRLLRETKRRVSVRELVQAALERFLAEDRS